MAFLHPYYFHVIIFHSWIFVLLVDNFMEKTKIEVCGYSLMAEHELPKPEVRVRFPLSAVIKKVLYPMLVGYSTFFITVDKPKEAKTARKA